LDLQLNYVICHNVKRSLVFVEKCVLFTLVVQSILSCDYVRAASLAGEIKGQIVDYRLNPDGKPLVTNLSSFSGLYKNGRFFVDVKPDATEDDFQESVGWTAETLYLIQRFPETPRKGLPRDKSLGVMEPTIFSRYATHATAALLMMLGDSNSVAVLTDASRPPILLGTLRVFSEEKNRYNLDYVGMGHWTVEAVCPPLRIESDNKETPLDSPVYSNGFRRWRFNSRVTEKSDTGMLISFVYERFRPKYKVQKPTAPDDLITDRRVEGNARMQYKDVNISDFRPDIGEASLIVWDFRGRKEFVQARGDWNKDYLVQHVLTNRSWGDAELAGVKRAAVTELGIKVMAEKEKHYASFRWLFYVAAAAVFALPLFLALKRRAEEQEKQGPKPQQKG